MTENSAIEWTENTINFYVGCTKVSPGCKNCYMFRLENRWGRDPSKLRKTNWINIERNLKKWKSSMIFANSMTDMFHEKLRFSDIKEMFDIITKYPQHKFQILTKRAERLPDYSELYGIPDNVWLGVSVEDNNHKNRIYNLQQTNAKIKFVSFEPLLDKIELYPIDSRIDWAIVGGESGFKPRLPKIEWIRDLIEQLKVLHIPTFYKQFGGNNKCRCHKAWGCRLIDGKTYDEMPVLEIKS